MFHSKKYAGYTELGHVQPLGKNLHGSLNGSCILYDVCVKSRTKINNIAKQVNFDDNHARGMEFDSYDGGDDYELTSVGLVEISKIFAMQIIFFSGALPFDGV